MSDITAAMASLIDARRDANASEKQIQDGLKALSKALDELWSASDELFRVLEKGSQP